MATKHLPLFYKGAGIGTHWHLNDARTGGFKAVPTVGVHSVNAVRNHIANYSYPSPYLSVSTSFAVAREYALHGGGVPPTPANPGHVYEVNLANLPTLTVYSPLEILTGGCLGRGVVPHQHTGDWDLLLCLAGSTAHGGVLGISVYHPTSHVPPTYAPDVKPLATALRDAEMLVFDEIPAICVTNRFDVY